MNRSTVNPINHEIVPTETQHRLNVNLNVPNTLTAEALVDVEIPTTIKLSPSGKHVLYALAPISRKGKHHVSTIWIAQVNKQHSARQLTSGFNDTQPRWSSDGQSIAFLSDRGRRGESSMICLLNLLGGEATPLTNATNKQDIATFEWSPDGKFIAFLSADEKTEERREREEAGNDAIVYGEWDFHRLRYVEVATRQVTTLVSNNAHITSITWKGGAEIVYMKQNTPELNSVIDGIKFQLVSLVDEVVEDLFEFPGPANSVTIHQDTQTLYFIAAIRPSIDNSATMVYKISLGDRQWCPYAYGEVEDSSRIQRDSERIWVAVASGLSTRFELLDGKEVLYESLHRINDWDIISGLDGAILVLAKSSISDPPEVYSVFNGKLCQLSQHGAEMASLGVAAAHPIYCKAKDGTALDGLFITSKTGQQKKPWPTLVQPHGGPYWRTQIDLNPSGGYWAPWVAAAGYAILAPNYRGGSGRGDKFANAAIDGVGTVDYDDVISMVKAGITDGLIDADKVVIGGWSQGGFLSYLAVTRSDFTFRGAICGAGISDWDMMCMTSDVPAAQSELSGKAPWEEGALKTQHRRGSPIWHMKNVKTPILILHGEKDVRVPVTQAVAFLRGCLHYKIPCQMITYPRENHLIQERAHQIDILKRVKGFLDIHLS